MSTCYCQEDEDRICCCQHVTTYTIDKTSSLFDEGCSLPLSEEVTQKSFTRVTYKASLDTPGSCNLQWFAFFERTSSCVFKIRCLISHKAGDVMTDSLSDWKKACVGFVLTQRRRSKSDHEALVQ